VETEPDSEKNDGSNLKKELLIRAMEIKKGQNFRG